VQQHSDQLAGAGRLRCAIANDSRRPTWSGGVKFTTGVVNAQNLRLEPTNAGLNAHRHVGARVASLDAMTTNASPSRRSRPARCALAVSVAVACLGGILACSSPDESCELGPYEDPTTHESGLVAVSDGVSLQYLDFGGTGRPLVFLAGAGDSAHVFDEFAPRFVDQYRVLALTRRGFGESSQPRTGYDSAHLADDIAAFLDSLNIDRAHIAGHSAAGVEMTELALRHSERVDALVYLDAAYDWAASADDPALQHPPTPPNPDKTQLHSPEAFASYVASINGLESFPVADVRATNVFDCNGRYVRSRTTAAVAAAFVNSIASSHPNYSNLQAPTLAIFTVPLTEDDMFPWLDNSPSQRPAAEAYFRAARASLAAQREAFASSQPDATVVNLESVPHFFFLAAPALTASTIMTFLERPE